jgi:hypothetical protein
MDRKRSASLLNHAIVGALFALLAASNAPAQVPQLINYQGYLTDTGRSPINGVQSITFSIYNSGTAGTEVWKEIQNVMVTDGLFTVLLGTVTPIPYTAFDSGEQYLAVRIGSAQELSPRQRLVSVPYCFNAREAEQLGGHAAAEFVRSVEGVAPLNGNIDLVAGSNVTINTNAQAHSVTISSSALTLPFSSTVSSSQTALTVLNSGTGYALVASANTYGVRATSSGVDGYAVYGVANGENARAIVGSTTGANGYGVWGSSSSHYGVHGISEETSPALAGVYGVATRSAAGVMGVSDSGRGMHGKSSHGTAVYAEGDLEATGAYKGNIRSASATDGAPFPRPAFDSGWLTIAATTTRTIEHGVGGDPDDYFVDMWERSGSFGRHDRGVGGDIGRSGNYGAYWKQLTSESIQVGRLSEDALAEQIRIRIWVIR